MSGGQEDDEIYSDSPTSEPVSDMRLKIAMFEKPKSPLAPILSRPTNGVAGPGPKPPAKLPTKKTYGQNKVPTSAALPPKNGKPAPKTVGPLSPRTQTNEEANPVRAGVGAPSVVRQSIFHQAESAQNAPVSPPTKTTLEYPGHQDTLYPPGKEKTDGTAPPIPPTKRSQDMDLIRVNGRIYRKLPFVVPKGPAPDKPNKSPDLSVKVENKVQAETEDIYEDASAYAVNKSNEKTQNDEEEYEDVGAFSEMLRNKRQEVTTCDDELYDDVNVTT